MTAIQICALIGLIIGAALLYWTGYRGGLIDGRIEGIDEGKAFQQSDNSEAIRSLEHSLPQVRAERLKLFTHYERALTASKLGEQEHQILLAIAEKLRIAAATFGAFRTGKKLERESVALREQALAIAERLKPIIQERQAEQSSGPEKPLPMEVA